MHQVRTFHIEGKLKELCGGESTFKIAASNMKMFVSYLCMRFGNHIKQYIADNNWQVFFDEIEGDGVRKENVHELGNTKDVYLLPHVEGSGKAGNIILGIVLIVIGVLTMYVPGGQAAGAKAIWTGASYIIAGAMMIYTALNTPKAQQNRAAVDERASFIFNGAVNVIEQGGAVPVAYGRSIVGSTVVSAGIDTEQITYYNSPLGTNIAPNSLFGVVDIL